jgi:glucokinase
LEKDIKQKYYIGMDLKGTNIKASIFDVRLKALCEKRISTEAEKGSGHVLNGLYELTCTMLKNEKKIIGN